MFEGSKTPINIFVEIWILQILMSVKLNFWYQQTVYILMAWKDPYGGLQNPYFLELQQKNVAAGENCPYGQVRNYNFNIIFSDNSTQLNLSLA